MLELQLKIRFFQKGCVFANLNVLHTFTFKFGAKVQNLGVPFTTKPSP